MILQKSKAVLSIAAIGACSTLFIGCGRKQAAESSASEDPAALPPGKTAKHAGREVLPGASSVREAVAKKDYQNAVGALLALKGAASASPQTEEYMNLYNEVKSDLIEAAATDKNAAEALMTLRATSAGR